MLFFELHRGKIKISEKSQVSGCEELCLDRKLIWEERVEEAIMKCKVEGREEQCVVGTLDCSYTSS